MRTNVEISLNFMPAFFAKHARLTYGEPYYFDPDYRAQVECAEARFLNECLGRYGVGSATPQPSANLFIQPVDLIMRTQGAEWHMPKDATLESWGTPWAGLTPDEIQRLDPRAAASHPVIDQILRQYRDMEKLYGSRADIFGIKGGTMNIHTPFTTAHQLYGEELFVLMLMDPPAARNILGKVWDIYQAVFQRIRQATGANPVRVQMGDCSAALVSEQAYREVVLPMNQAILENFRSAGYHSCGSSSHLLTAFAELPRVDAVELGPGTDLRSGTALLSDKTMRPLVDPKIMKAGSDESIRDLVGGLLRDTANAPAVTLCAWSFDRDTPIANVAALYETVAKSQG